MYIEIIILNAENEHLWNSRSFIFISKGVQGTRGGSGPPGPRGSNAFVSIIMFWMWIMVVLTEKL